MKLVFKILFPDIHPKILFVQCPQIIPNIIPREKDNGKLSIHSFKYFPHILSTSEFVSEIQLIHVFTAFFLDKLSISHHLSPYTYLSLIHLHFLL